MPKRPFLKVTILVFVAILSFFASLNAAWHCLERAMGASALRGTIHTHEFQKWSDSSGRWFAVCVVLFAASIALSIWAVKTWRKSSR
jgi:hypothetical protein